MPRLSRLREDEGGFTLVELLVAMVIGLAVTMGAFLLLDTSVKSQKRTQQRVEGVANGRAAFEQIVRQLRSQVCVGTEKPMLDAQASDVMFHASMDVPTQSGVLPIKRRRILWAPDASGGRGRILERQYDVTSGTYPNLVFADVASPSRERTLARGVSLIDGVPLFTYWKFSTTLKKADGSPELVKLIPPISADDLNLIVKVDVAFQSIPVGTTTSDNLETQFRGSALARTADPSDPAGSPRCPS